MNKKTYLRILLAILCILMLSGCQQSGSEDYTLPEYVNSTPYPDYPVRKTLDAYNEMLETEYIPESFLYYEDLAFIGDYYAYCANGKKTVEGVHLTQEYHLRDENGGVKIVIWQPKVAYDDPDWTYTTKTTPNMPERENFYHEPALTDKSINGSYHYSGINYLYEDGVIIAIIWPHGDYMINIFPYGENMWETYPDVENDAFVSRLLHADTAVAAKNQLDRAIFWRQTRVFLKKAAPIAIPVICVLAVGIPTLVIYCRKKRKTQTEKTE